MLITHDEILSKIVNKYVQNCVGIFYQKKFRFVAEMMHPYGGVTKMKILQVSASAHRLARILWEACVIQDRSKQGISQDAPNPPEDITLPSAPLFGTAQQSGLPFNRGKCWIETSHYLLHQILEEGQTMWVSRQKRGCWPRSLLVIVARVLWK